MSASTPTNPALRKMYQGTRWIFSETHNLSNPASHCYIACGGALASERQKILRRRHGGLIPNLLPRPGLFFDILIRLH